MKRRFHCKKVEPVPLYGVMLSEAKHL